MAEDSAGNKATLVIKVEVVLASAPLIKLVGQSPLVVEAGAVYSDPGATAVDIVDGDLSADIVSSAVDGAVDSAKLGTYEVVYRLSKSNSRGLDAEPVRRTVIVRDTTPPVCLADKAHDRLPRLIMLTCPPRGTNSRLRSLLFKDYDPTWAYYTGMGGGNPVPGSGRECTGFLCGYCHGRRHNFPGRAPF